MVTPGANRGRAGQRQHLEWGGESSGKVSTRGVIVFLSILSGSGSRWAFSTSLSVSLNHPCEALVTFEWSNHEPVHHSLLTHGIKWTMNPPLLAADLTILLFSQVEPPLQLDLPFLGPGSSLNLPPL